MAEMNDQVRIVPLVTVSERTLLERADVDVVAEAIPKLIEWIEWPDRAVNGAVADGVALIVGCRLPTPTPRLLAVARIATNPVTPTRPELSRVWGVDYGACPETLHFASIVLVPADNPHHLLRESWWRHEGEGVVHADGRPNYTEWRVDTGILQGAANAIHPAIRPFWIRTRDGVAGLLDQ